MRKSKAMNTHKAMKIITDTNFLVDVVRFRIGLDFLDSLGDLVLGRFELVAPESVEMELGRMKSSDAKLALRIARTRVRFMEYAEGRTTDDKIVNLAKKLDRGGEKTAVATNDAALRKRLKALGIKTIYLRARKHLEMG